MSTTLPSRAIASSSITRISSNWRELSALVGVVIAVAGLAAAFFINASWWLVACFGLLSASSIASWQTAKSYAELNRLAISTRNLQASQTQLQQSEVRLSAALSQIQTERVALNNNIRALQGENQNLQRENNEMRTNNEHLATANTALQRNATILQQQKQELQNQIETLQTNLQQLTIQVRQLVDRDAAVAHRLGTMQLGIQSIHQEGTRVENSNVALQGTLAELNRLIQLQGSVSERNTQHLEEQSGKLGTIVRSLETQIKEASAQSHTAQDLEQQVAGARTALISLNKQLEDKLDKINKANELYKKICKELDAKLAQSGKQSGV